MESVGGRRCPSRARAAASPRSTTTLSQGARRRLRDCSCAPGSLRRARGGALRRAVRPSGHACRRRPDGRLRRGARGRGRSSSVSAPAGSRCHLRSAASVCTGSIFEAMVARLRAKPGAEQVAVTVGDFATTTVEGTFSVVYLVANTIMNLTTQDEQVACFRNAAAHLEPNGCFVIEVLVPRLQRLPPGERYQPFSVEPTHRLRRIRRRPTGPDLAPLLDRGRQGRRDLAAVPLRMAVGARPHGAAGRDDAARALGRLEP